MIYIPGRTVGVSSNEPNLFGPFRTLWEKRQCTDTLRKEAMHWLMYQWLTVTQHINPDERQFISPKHWCLWHAVDDHPRF